MHVASGAICDGEVLAYDLDFIRRRHVFLDRCGIYKNPHPKSVGLTATAEPPVDRLLGTHTRCVGCIGVFLKLLDPAQKNIDDITRVLPTMKSSFISSTFIGHQGCQFVINYYKS